MIKVYGGAFSRASIVTWYLEELGIPYEFVLLDMKQGEHLKPDFLAINPMGKVPAIVEGDCKLWESGAIILYLAEKYDNLTDFNERTLMTQWVLFANSTLSTGIFVETSRDRETPKLMGPLNDLFSQHLYVTGDRFTVADIAVGSVLAYIPIMLKLDLSAYPAVMDYIQRISDRPAFQRTISAKFPAQT
ncbi:MAG: glutathione S-transferase family protein [Chloroflexaceae bacterium]|nr:glutathione S-transferase family protein [Chloroflexaceae bacterium]